MATRLTELHTNRIWSWHTSPLAKKVGNYIYTVAVNNADDWAFLKYVTTTQAITTAKIYDGYETDDHNAPSLCFNTGKRTFVLFGRHKQSSQVNYASTDVGDTVFGNVGNKSFPDVTTYSQIMNTGGNALTGLTRVGNKAWYTFITSNYQDNPVSFTNNKFIEATDIDSQLYIHTRRSEDDPDLWHLVVLGHPIEGVHRDMYYGTINYSTGAVDIQAGNVGNFRTPTNTPIHPTDLEAVGLAETNVRHRFLGVGDKHGQTYIDVCKWTTNNTDIDNEYWRYVRQTDGTWDGFYLGVSAGTPFYGASSSKYVGGIDSDRNGANKCYVAYEDSGTHYLYMYPINSDLTLDDTNKVLIDSGSNPLVRPFCVQDDDSIIFQELTSYTDYRNFSSSMWLYEGNV